MFQKAGVDLEHPSCATWSAVKPRSRRVVHGALHDDLTNARRRLAGQAAPRVRDLRRPGHLLTPYVCRLRTRSGATNGSPNAERLAPVDLGAPTRLQPRSSCTSSPTRVRGRADAEGPAVRQHLPASRRQLLDPVPRRRPTGTMSRVAQVAGHAGAELQRRSMFPFGHRAADVRVIITKSTSPGTCGRRQGSCSCIDSGSVTTHTGRKCRRHGAGDAVAHARQSRRASARSQPASRRTTTHRRRRT